MPMNTHSFDLITSGDACPRRCAMVRGIITVFALFASILALAPAARCQQLTRVERDLAEAMLQNISSDVHKYYFDPKLAGLDWDTLVRQTKLKIDQASNMTVANAEIEALLENLADSHTVFLPPRNLVTADYGWKFQIIGKRTFVTEVSPKSDAEKQGVHPGDEVLTLDGYAVDRAGIPRLQYAMNVIPQNSLKVSLRDPSGKTRDLDLAAKLTHHPPVLGLGDSTWFINQQRINGEDAWDKAKSKYKEFGPELMILRIPQFAETRVDVENLIKKARTHKTLIVDLRGNPGGRVDSVADFLSGVFNRDVKVGKAVQRDKSQSWEIKSSRKGSFEGDLIVLVDSVSASGAEIFARVVQLEERGTILGDHSSGRVMEAQIYTHHYGQSPFYIFGDEVSVADTVMSDGKSLEGVGVKPDRTSLPTAADLAAGRDPVLAYAASLAGVTLSPEDAAKLFPKPKPTPEE